MNERDKYTEVWKHDAYRAVAPGEFHVGRFAELSACRTGSSVCDFGCGTGRAARRIAAITGATVTGLDFAGNCLDAGSGELLHFRQHDLNDPVGEHFDYGFCTDVLEHLPPEQVDRVLTNVFTSARRVYLAVSTVDDVMGRLIGEPLHLTVESPFWWHDKLTELGIRIDASGYVEGMAWFWASGFMDGSDIAANSSLNVENDILRQNIIANMGLGLREIAPHEAQPDKVIYLLAGGPSLSDYEQQIIEAGRAGMAIVTVNGTYNWLLERGIKPAAHVMLDARGFNRRFIEPVVDTCKYLMCSQCDHEAVKSLPREQTWLWHSGDSELVKDTLREYSEKHGILHEYTPVIGGTTVVSRALVMLAMLGFRRIEVFGWDSCLREDKHHAYPQPENDGGRVVEVTCGGRTFRCNGWMIVQANEFPTVVRQALAQVPDFEMIVHGDGLIAHMIDTAATLAQET